MLIHIIPNPLPTGSDLSEFDPSVWMDPNSVEYVRCDITPRQKMLVAVIAKLGREGTGRSWNRLLARRWRRLTS